VSSDFYFASRVNLTYWTMKEFAHFGGFATQRQMIQILKKKGGTIDGVQVLETVAETMMGWYQSQGSEQVRMSSRLWTSPMRGNLP